MPEVFVSYSHDSAEHKERVLNLVKRLIHDGIDCHLDRFEVSPAEGWPKWMQRNIGGAKYVLVVCTETYRRRVMDEEEPGRGLGARWEGGIITQALYDSEGRNEKFIPIVFGPSDVAGIPPFLRSSTYYLIMDADDDEGYDALYRHLTGQPAVVKPALGTRRILPPLGHVVEVNAADSRETDGERIAIAFRRRVIFLTATQIRLEESLRLTIRPGSSVQAVSILELRQQSTPVWIAYGLRALQVEIKSVEEVRERGAVTFNVTCTVLAREPIGVDIGTGSLSSDDVAVLRARRILLGETSAHLERSAGDEQIVEALIHGVRTYIAVTESPFPSLYSETNRDRDAFMSAAPLLAVFWLYLSGTVEYIYRLDLRFVADHKLEVDFEGRRPRVAPNLEPRIIGVSGVCNLIPG